MLTRKQQLAIYGTSTAVTFNTAVRDAQYARMKIEDLTIKYNTNQETRNPQRATIGNVANVAGAQSATITWKVPIGMSGTAGVAPSWDTALLSCGWAKTVASGSAATGSVFYVPPSIVNTTVAAQAEIIRAGTTIAGSYTDTQSGYYVISFTAYSGNNLTVLWTLFKSGGGTETGTATVDTSTGPPTTAVSIGNGLTISYASTAVDEIDNMFGVSTLFGTTFRFNVTSSSEVSTVYKRVGSAAIPYCCMAIYQDGLRHEFKGCLGNAAFSWEKTGAIGYINFTFQGIVSSEPVSASMLTGIQYETTIPPAFKGVTSSLLNQTPACFTAFGFDSGNQVIVRECAEDATGNYSAVITGYEMTATIDPLQSVTTTPGYVGNFLGGDLSDFSFTTIGSTSGNIFAVSGLVVQMTDYAQGDRNGELTGPMTLRMSEPEYEAGADYGGYQATITLT
jgi:hypothetical protein